MIARFFSRVKHGIDIVMKIVYNAIMQNNYKEVEKQAKELEKLARKMKREEMQALRDQGLTLEEIGERYTPKLTRERVRQILKGDD
jgi:DNA-directed RNA polymerase sigma subunit (sigma70/sigma32)